jgi:hypothetical protein
VRSRVKLLAVSLLMLSVGLAAGISEAVGNSGNDNHKHGQDAHRLSHRSASIPSQLRSSYSFLRSNATSTDPSLPDGWQAGAMVAQYGLEPDLAKYAGSPDGTSVWFIPGQSGSCIVIGSGGGACGPNAPIAAQGIDVGVVPTSGAPSTVFGVVPDGATITATSSPGPDAPVPVSGNAFGVSSAHGIRTFTITLRNGAKSSETLPRAPSSVPNRAVHRATRTGPPIGPLPPSKNNHRGHAPRTGPPAGPLGPATS